ncbi:MAG: 1-acyl-sn-glycerol-3-phosphate acyltransferase, partial [Boseongicola sp.]|nr:1-acyl-sn-glycerol-3-phosphate acyltransferase [Boseongicola sp.]
VYTAPEGAAERFYGWWGDMEFGAHLAKVLASHIQGSVEVIWHEPLKVGAFSDRKGLAKAAEEAVRSAFES